ncbi:DUF4132 domain-containing protein [Longispora sp. NPDC051575]|uniref:DUF4132 domain-containing protein n=1 Tax=Longispora sp. NPDC051575 TaxID=3154943 RepID=UPI00342167DF
MAWLTAAGGYEVTLREGSIVSRNAAGKELRTLPKTLRDDPAVVGLRQLTEWFTRHGTECRADVERWMIRSLPVPAALLAQVWADETWRTTLTDLVVAVLDQNGQWDPEEVGFLRHADEAGIGVVTLDGETVRLPCERVLIPHPVTLTELDDLREFAADLGGTQTVAQLFRETWTRPADLDPLATAVDTYSGGRFEQLRHLMARAASQGYPVRGGYAVCRVVEGGDIIEARSWIGSDDPYYETETGDLVFVGPSGKALPVSEVGPVTWSEGMRMAAALYAGRTVEKNETES